jgi:hypothetical protein
MAVENRRKHEIQIQNCPSAHRMSSASPVVKSATTCLSTSARRLCKQSVTTSTMPEQNSHPSLPRAGTEGLGEQVSTLLCSWFIRGPRWRRSKRLGLSPFRRRGRPRHKIPWSSPQDGSISQKPFNLIPIIRKLLSHLRHLKALL